MDRTTRGLLGAVLAAAVLVGCSGDDGSASGGPTSCPNGACGPVVCGPDERADGDAAGACKPIGWSACPAGFAAAPGGHGCLDVLASSACAAGSMPVLGETTCKPVGPAACAQGFERDASGWGCAASIPAAACTGATKETLGSDACAPIGDCNAPFPPPDATVFVDASYGAGQIDATHVRTIGAALAAAPPNAVVAVAPGTYTEAIAPAKPVRIVGRCAAQVTLASPGADAAGVAVDGAVAVTIEGLTVSGHLRGVVASRGASVTLRDDVVTGNRGRGAFATDGGTTLTVEGSSIRGSVDSGGINGTGIGLEATAGAGLVVRDSAVTDNVDTGIRTAGAGSHLHVEHSAVLRTQSTAASDFGVGVVVRDGASGEVVASAVAQNHEVGVLSYGKGTALTITDATIADTMTSGAGYGRGVIVDTGAATLERVTITKSRDVGLLVEAGGSATVTSSVVASTQPGSDDANGDGLVLLTGGTAAVTSTAVVGNMDAGIASVGAKAKLTLADSIVADTAAASAGDRGYGITVESGAVADVHGSALVENTEGGIAATDAGTTVSVTRTVVSGTKPGKTGRHGRAMSIESGAAATVDQCALVANHDIAVDVRGKGASATIDETVARGTLPQAADGTHGRGIEAGSGATVTVSRTSLVGNHDVSMTSLSTGSRFDIRDSWIADTAPDASPGTPGRAATVQDGATMSLLGVWIQRSRQIALAAGASSTLSVKSSIVEDTAFADGDSFGHGLVAFDGSLATVDDVTIRHSAGAALVFSASRGTVHSTRIIDNAVGIHVQDGSELSEADDVPDDPPDGAVVVSSDSSFEGNGSRVGSGAIPLPAPIE